MNHPAELTLAQYMTDAANGEAVMSDATIEKIGKDVMDALKRQFGGGTKRKDFALRMSNVGRPSCQLWFQKNRPNEATPMPSNFVMNMMLGDIVEAIFKGLLTEAKVAFEDADLISSTAPSIAISYVPLIVTGMSIASNRRRAKEFESVAEMRHTEKMANGEVEYQKAVMQNNQQGWKDEFVLILVSAPVMLLIWSIFSDDPEIMEKVDKFFNQFNNMPFWYQALFIGVVSAIYGLKGADIIKKK